jgi:hypothetical protein
MYDDDNLKRHPLPLHVAALIAGQGGFKDGELITHDWLNTQLEISKPQGAISAEEWDAYGWKRMSLIEALKKQLLEKYGRVLNSETGEGYRLLPREQHVQYVVLSLDREWSRTTTRGLEILVHTETNDFTPTKRAEYSDAHARLTRLAHKTGIDIDALKSKCLPNPESDKKPKGKKP